MTDRMCSKSVTLMLLVVCWFMAGVVVGHAQSAPARIVIDGSQALYPLSRAVVQGFEKVTPEVKVVLHFSGSGPGFKKLCSGEIDICNASRPIKLVESELCVKQGIGYIELPVAYDAVVVVVNAKNEWAGTITIEELKKIWEPAAQGRTTRWNQVRPSWPPRPIHLYGPAVESGTYDYFTAAVLGTEGTSRGDFSPSIDMMSVVRGISGDINGLGFLALSFWLSNQGELKALPIQEAGKVSAPSLESVKDGSYRLLSRPLFIYVNAKTAGQPAVKKFVEYYLSNAGLLTKEHGYAALQQEGYKAALKRFRAGTTGTLFGGQGARVGLSMDDLRNMQE